MAGNKIRRETTVGFPTCLLGFSGRDSVDSAVFDSTTLSLGGVTEVQTLTVTGTPTGGTFTLSYKGQTTAPIAYNASAATIQTELRKLTRLGAVTAAGGALPGAAVTITFTGKLANQDTPLITANGAALTGGSAPTASVAQTTKGDSKYAGKLVLTSGLPLMASTDGKKVIAWDGQSATTLVGIFDGFRELLGPEDYPVIPVYNHECVFDRDVVLNYATNSTWRTNYNTWAAAHVCQFKAQGS